MIEHDSANHERGSDYILVELDGLTSSWRVVTWLYLYNWSVSA